MKQKNKYCIDTELFKECLQNAITLDCLCEILKNITIISSELEKDIEDTPFEIIPHLMYLALVDKEGVTEENILDEYGLNDMQEVMQVFEKAFYGSLPVDTEKKTDKMKR